MEHIVTLGISIDDEAIKKGIKEDAEKCLIEQLLDEVNKELDINVDSDDDSEWKRIQRSAKLKSLIETHIDQYCENHKDEIIELAATKLAEKLSRTKAAKEKVQEVLDQLL